MKKPIVRASVTKLLTGIQGFDEITIGGLPRSRTTLVMGGPGCGKTVFALQILVNGVGKDDEPGMFVAFEESTSQIVANAATFGWDLPALAKKDLFFLDARLAPEVVKAGEFDLIGMLSLLERKAEEIGAKRVVRVRPRVHLGQRRSCALGRGPFETRRSLGEARAQPHNVVHS